MWLRSLLICMLRSNHNSLIPGSASLLTQEICVAGLLQCLTKPEHAEITLMTATLDESGKKHTQYIFDAPMYSIY